MSDTLQLTAEERRAQQIEHLARAVIERMIGGTLFGKRIDPKNLNEMILAAYMIGRTEYITRSGDFEPARVKK